MSNQGESMSNQGESMSNQGESMSNQGESTSNSFNAECSSVQTHVQMMQAVIRRMAKNSSACKLQCIVTVAAILLATIVHRPESIWVSLAPAFIFLILDTYYLGLEKRFRESYKSFVCKLAKGKLTTSDLYVVEPSCSMLETFFCRLCSVSIWPFYIIIFVTILIVWCLIYAADPGEVCQPFRNKWGMEGWNKWGMEGWNKWGGTAGSGCGPHITGR